MSEEADQVESDQSDAYKPLEDEKIKEIALGINRGEIYTSQHIKNDADVTLVFAIINLMPPDQIEWIRENKIAVFYEYLSKASPMSINGLPSFLSCKMLDDSDWERVLTKLKAIEEALDAV